MIRGVETRISRGVRQCVAWAGFLVPMFATVQTGPMGAHMLNKV